MHPALSGERVHAPQSRSRENSPDVTGLARGFRLVKDRWDQETNLTVLLQSPFIVMLGVLAPALHYLIESSLPGRYFVTDGKLEFRQVK